MKTVTIEFELPEICRFSTCRFRSSNYECLLFGMSQRELLKPCQQCKDARKKQIENKEFSFKQCEKVKK